MITVHKVSDYKKSGGLKKSAKALYSTDSEDYKEIAKEIIALEVEVLSTPYFFTSIHGAINGEEIRIVESVCINGIDLVTTPQKLAEALKLR